MASATIKIFLVHADPKRLRTAEISNWTGKAVAGPRSEFDGVLAREESQGSGVYFLTGTDPESGRPESDREDMEIFLEKINQLLPVLGVELLVPAAATVLGENERRKLFCEIKGLKAVGHLTPNGFLVLKGSQAVLTERASSHKWPWALNMRQRLKEESVLENQGDYLVFSKDTEFTSPSSAAAVIHGGHANGLTAWKDKDGKTLKEIESV